MTYNSVGEIFEEIDGTRERLVRSVEGLSEEQQVFRPAPDRWSAADILEHLSVTEKGIVRLFNMALKKLEDAGQLCAEGAAFAPVNIKQHVERSKREKYKAPEQIAPRGDIPAADSLARLRETRSVLHSLRPRIEAADCAAALYPHPAFGPLNLYQWLAFIGVHEARHLAQIETLKEAMNTER